MADEMKDLLYYKRCFLHLNRSSRKGEKAPHKPILLLAVIDRVESLIAMGIAGGRMINQNLIDLNPKLEQFFYKHWNQYVSSDAFVPSFSMPFYHMEGEPFWKLVLKKNAEPQGGQNESNLYKYYNGAQIDEDLMLLLLEDESREELRKTLIHMLQSPEQELPLEEAPSHDTKVDDSNALELRKDFWDYFYHFQAERNGIYKDATTSRIADHTSRYAYGAHVTSLLFDKKVRVEVYWNKWGEGRNKEIFDEIAIDRSEIEDQIGVALDWQRLDDKNACRISITKTYLYKKKSDHPLIAELFTEVSGKFWEVIIPYFKRLIPPGRPQLSSTVDVVSDDAMCMLFQNFMRDNGASENSIRKYSKHVAHNKDVKEIITRITGQDSLFKVLSIEDATKILAEVKASPCDIIGHHMYSVGLSHYIRFLSARIEKKPIIENPDLSKARRSNLNFYEMGLKQGDVLSWVDDPNITAEVIAPKKVLYREQAYSLSTLSAILKGYNAKHISPCPYWLYKGKNLSDIYVATYSEPEKPNQEAEEIRKKEDSTDAVVLFDHAVDYSFFNYGCTLDKKFHQTIFDVLGGRIERGQRQDIVLIYDGKEFAAQFENVDRHGVSSDTIRLMWKGRSDSKLSTYLQQKFANEYRAIAQLHDQKFPIPSELLHNVIVSKSGSQYLLTLA